MPTPITAVLARYQPGPGQRAVADSLRRCLRVLGHPPLIHAFPWQDLTRVDVLTMWARLSRAAPSVQRLSRVALKHVFRECWRSGLLTERELAVLLDDWPRVQGSREPPGRALTQLELAELFAVAQAQPPIRAARDAGLLAVLAGTGCRRFEAASLALADIQIGTHSLRIRGKGNTVRAVPLLVPPLWTALTHWLEVRGDQAGPVFVRLSRWNTLTEKRLAVASVNGVLHRLTTQAGVVCTPHDLRRTGITWLLEAGVDVDAVQRWAGHRHLATTLAYRRPTVDPVETAARALKEIMAHDQAVPIIFEGVARRGAEIQQEG